jgi:lipoate synthase
MTTTYQQAIQKLHQQNKFIKIENLEPEFQTILDVIDRNEFFFAL